MEQLLMATARALSARRIERVRAGLGGDRANVEWQTRLGDLIRAEAVSDEGRAVVELLVGARTSAALAGEVRAAIDASIEFAAREIARVVGDSPLAHIGPPMLIAELATAAFLGLEVLTQSGRDLDIDRIASTTSAVMQLMTSLLKASITPAG